MQLFSKHKNAEIHVFKRFRRFFILLIICAKTNSPPQLQFGEGKYPYPTGYFSAGISAQAGIYF
nr:MAG TPA: hypothetical protein [Caudoviricetes sp.]